MPKIDGATLRKVLATLGEAFEDYEDVEMLTRFALNERLGNLANKFSKHDHLIFKLWESCEARGWTARLLVGARVLRPDNSELFEVSRLLGLSATTESLSSFERLISARAPFFDPKKFVQNLIEHEGRVCRVETPNDLGTGFLVGPDFVLTCKHVIGATPAARIKLRFDYYVALDGTNNPGQEEPLATDGIVATSDPDPADFAWKSHESACDPAHCDYALLRLKNRVGDNPRLAAARGGDSRGWIRVPKDDPGVGERDLLFIVQHPKGDPVKLAFGVETTGVRGFNANTTRMNHGVNTEGGSSGSPCFDHTWNLVALHQGTNADGTGIDGSNRAIPILRVREHLRALGKEAVLDE